MADKRPVVIVPRIRGGEGTTSAIDVSNGYLQTIAADTATLPQDITSASAAAENRDMFGRLRISSGTSSTCNTNQASTPIAVGNLTAGSRVRQTFRRFNTPAPQDISLGASIAGIADTLFLAVQRITGTSETFYASMNYREII